MDVTGRELLLAYGMYLFSYVNSNRLRWYLTHNGQLAYLQSKVYGSSTVARWTLQGGSMLGWYTISSVVSEYLQYLGVNTNWNVIVDPSYIHQWEIIPSHTFYGHVAIRYHLPNTTFGCLALKYNPLSAIYVATVTNILNRCIDWKAEIAY